ncbi:hypothetical protein QL285_089509 [Trifolium repens]|nr:hypothetical protein QL285_089509 [Trifolium repens]
MQISAYLETIINSKKNPANLSRFVSVQKISYRRKSITHGINHTPAVPDPTPPRQHLTTTPQHHLHLRSVAATTPFSDPSQPPPPPHLRSIATTTPPHHLHLRFVALTKKRGT